MDQIERYYRFQSKIYDATRWLFLFGRTTVIDELAKAGRDPRHIVEIGCGTGRNLAVLARRFSAAKITGIDLSEEMLCIARRKLGIFGDRIALQHRVHSSVLDEPADAVLFSYSLSMMNPGWQTALASAVRGLTAGGVLAVVDFHDAPVKVFASHMSNHHVRMEAHLLPVLAGHAEESFCSVRRAYGGLWRYFVFAGKKLSSAG